MDVTATRPLLTALLLWGGSFSGAWLGPEGEAGRAPDVAGAPARIGAFTAGLDPSLYFAPNRGQWSGEVLFMAERPGFAARLTAGGIRIDSRSDVGGRPPAAVRAAKPGLWLKFMGANSNHYVEGVASARPRAHYLLGGDSSRWRHDLPTYRSVIYRDLWRGVDMTVEGRFRELKYSFQVAPGADPSLIGLSYDSAQVELDGEGNLQIASGTGRWQDRRPQSHQVVNGRQVPVATRFQIRPGGVVGFQLGHYEPSLPLVIDPGLRRSSYFGGSGSEPNDQGPLDLDVALDAKGNIYLSGSTTSDDLPGAGSGVSGAGSDVFVAVFNPRGDLLESVVLGGSGRDSGSTVAVSSRGVFVAGQTESADFPMAGRALDHTYNGGLDGFLVRLDNGRLKQSTYLGGSADDTVRDLVVGRGETLFLGGFTDSADFPTTPQVVQPLPPAAGINGFAASLHPLGGSLLYSTYLGGSAGREDRVLGLAAAPDGSLYLAGLTSDPAFPVTPGAVREDLTGQDGFVAQLDRRARSLTATYWGGSGDDSAHSIALLENGRLAIAGLTGSQDLPVTGRALASGHRGGERDFFVSLLETDLSSVHYSTYLGGEADEGTPGLGPALAVGDDGLLRITGSTRSANFPTTPGAPQRSPLAPGHQIVYTEIDSLQGLLFSTYLSGSGEDFGLALVVDGRLDTHLAGATASEDFPMADTAEPGHGGGLYDAVLSRLGAELDTAVVFAGETAGIGEDVSILSGDVIAGGIGERGSIGIGEGSTTLRGFLVAAHQIEVGEESRIHSNLLYDRLRNHGSPILGVEMTPFDLRLEEEIPPLQPARPGELPIRLKARQSARLDAGAYNEVRVGNGATLLITGGEVHVKSFRVDKGARVLFLAAAEVRIQEEIRIAKGVFWGPEASSDVRPEEIVVQVEGASRKRGNAAVRLDGDSRIAANIIALRGLIWVGPGTHVRGALLGAEVFIGKRSVLQAASFLADRKPPPNSDPVALPDEAETSEDEAAEIAVLANDSDPDGDPLALISFSPPSHGEVSQETAGVLVYVPDRDFFGPDIFSYRVGDGRGGEATAEVFVTVSPVNDSPIARDDATSVGEDGMVEIGVLANDSDPDGDPLTILSFTQGAHGEVAMTAAGGLQYRPAENFYGPDAFSYRIADPSGATDQAEVRVEVEPVNDPPVAEADRVDTPEDTAVEIDPLANDADPDGDPLRIVSFTQGQNGQVAQTTPGVLQYRPNADFNGLDSFFYRVSDPSGSEAAAQVEVEVAAVNDPPVVSLFADPREGDAPLSVRFQATVTDVDSAVFSLSWVFGDGSSRAGQETETHVYANAGEYFATVAVSDGQLQEQDSVLIRVSSSLPPDPAQVAPSVDRSVATLLSEATSFLYQGSDPIQTGVQEGTIDPVRAALVRGRVLDRSSDPLAGVSVSVLDHPEFGETLTRLDGAYDLVINGGGAVTLEFGKPGFHRVHRQVSLEWHEYRVQEDVVMIEPDARVTTVPMGAPQTAVARGGRTTDSDGSRQATLIFPAALGAEMVREDGTRQPLDQLSVRATEFTVAENGPLAMPAPLPPSSFYTYAVSLTSDEAGEDSRVEFDRPVPFYIENFLVFPVGTEVPLGNYDPEAASWVAAENGVVLEILSVEAGLAHIDSDGDGMADGESQLSMRQIDEAERRKLAELYPAGQTLWRVLIPHFSIWDLNWGFGPPPDAEYPELPDLYDPSERPEEEPCEISGSIIECQNQVLGERVPIIGSPFTLNYRSDRVPGRAVGRRLEIPLSGSSLPSSLMEIQLEVSVAGRRFAESFDPLPNQKVDFEWDGQDAYGRVLQGQQTALVRVGYSYEGGYRTTPEFGAAPFGSITGSSLRNRLTLWQEQRVPLGPFWDARQLGIGGWTLSAHHVYDPLGRILYRGDGARRSAAALPNVISSFLDQGLLDPRAVASSADGALFVADGRRVLRIEPDGEISAFAGTGAASGPLGDGGPATAARLLRPEDLAVGPDGSVFIADEDDNRVRRVWPDGVITTVAGTGVPGYGGDGGPGPQGQLSQPNAVAAAADGTVYISDPNNRRVRRVSPDGRIFTAVGTGTFGSGGDGGLAVQAQLREPTGLAVDQHGSLYVADRSANKVRRVTVDGIIRTVAGNGGFGPLEDGVPALQTRLFNPQDIDITSDGVLLIVESNSTPNQHRIRQVRPDGIISTMAGGTENQDSGDGGPATAAGLFRPRAVGLGEAGEIYVVTSGRIRRVSQPVPGFTAGEIVLAAANGSEVYVFDSLGRHRTTRHALTGATLLEFEYGASGALAIVRNADGNQTRIERDSQGAPTAVVAPFGQRTELSVDANGFLSAITLPHGAGLQMTYSAGGLLQDFSDARGHSTLFQYDAEGRLLQSRNSLGGTRTFSRADSSAGYEVTKTTGSGRFQRHLVEALQTGDRRLVATFSDGTQTVAASSSDGSTEVTYATGMAFSRRVSPDPRFGMTAALGSSLTMTSPGGLVSTASAERSVVLADPLDPFSLVSQTDTLSSSDGQMVNVYEAALRRFTTTSPEGRQATVSIDERGRVIERRIGDLLPARFTYGPNGELTEVRQGIGPKERVTQLGYDSLGNLDSLTDTLGRTLGYSFGARPQPSQLTLRDGSAIAFGYDGGGNYTSVTPPDRPAHGFQYNALGQQEMYSPPVVGAESGETEFVFSNEGELQRIVGPDGVVVSFGRDLAGRIESIGIPRGTSSFAYDAAGRLSQITAADGGQLSFGYDGGLVVSESWSGQVSGSLDRSFDANFRLSNLTVDGSPSIDLLYDRDGLLTSAGDIVLTRDPATGLLSSSTLGGVEESWQYNGFGEPVEYSAAYSGNSLYSVLFTRDSLGRIVEKEEVVTGAPTDFAYSYDIRGRLTEVRVDGVLESRYTYDAQGNRLSGLSSGSTETGVYDAQDRLTQYGSTVYAYKASGELLSKTEGDSTTVYEYDPLGNLISVDLPDGTRIEYVVDGLNRRIGKRVDGVLVQAFLYADRLNPLAELDALGNIRSLFVYGSRRNVPDYMVRDGVTYRILSDHLGSPRLVVDVTNGDVKHRLDYDEFGNVLFDSQPGFQPFGFAGGIMDHDTGLIRYGARDYDPRIGRWTAKDPLRFQSGDSNFYAYVLGDPVNLTDPSGLAVFCAGLGAGYVFGSPGVATAAEVQSQYCFDSNGDTAIVTCITGSTGAGAGAVAGLDGALSLASDICDYVEGIGFGASADVASGLGLSLGFSGSLTADGISIDTLNFRGGVGAGGGVSVNFISGCVITKKLSNFECPQRPFSCRGGGGGF